MEGEEENFYSFSQEAIARFKAERTAQQIRKASTRMDHARQNTRESEEQVEQLEAHLEQARARLDVCRGCEKGTKKTLEGLKRKKTEEENQVNQAAAMVKANVDSVLNLDITSKCRKECGLDDNEAQFLEAIHNVRDLMTKGKIEEANTAEATLTAWLNSDEDEGTLPSPSRLGKPGHFAYHAMFVRPFSICSDEQLEATIQYARENPEQVFLDPDFGVRAIMEMSGRYAHKFRDDYPECNLEILNEIRALAGVLDKVEHSVEADHDEAPDDRDGSSNGGDSSMSVEQDGNSDGDNNSGSDNQDASSDGDDSGESNDQDDSSDQNDYREDKYEAMWEAIVPSLHKYQEQKLHFNKLQLELPSERSAPIARFNTEAHFRFASPAALESTSPLTKALVRCELREIPAYDLDLNGTVCAPRPFVCGR